MPILSDYQAWYSNHVALRSAVVFLHIGAIVVAGGSAISTNLLTLRARHRGLAERGQQLQRLAATHRLVVAGLAVIVASGLLQFASDPGTFLASVVFWTKMGLVVLLLSNGIWLLLCESAARQGLDKAWARLATASRFSVVLWLATTLAGSILLNS